MRGKTTLLVGGLAKSHQRHTYSVVGGYRCFQKKRISIFGTFGRQHRPLPSPVFSPDGSTRAIGKGRTYNLPLGSEMVFDEDSACLRGYIGLVLAGLGRVV